MQARAILVREDEQVPTMYSGVMAHGRIGAMHGGRRLVAGGQLRAACFWGCWSLGLGSGDGV